MVKRKWFKQNYEVWTNNKFCCQNKKQNHYNTIKSITQCQSSESGNKVTF